MKLSEMTGTQGLEMIGDLLVPIGEIAMDTEAMQSILIMQYAEGDSTLKQIQRGIKNGLGNTIKKHSASIVAILACVNGKSVEEYDANAGFMQLVKDLVDLVNDPVLNGLFLSAQTSENDGSCGSAQESTAAEA